MQSTSTQNLKNQSMKSQTVDESYVCRISLYITNKKAMIEHLDLSRFKTEKCPKEVCRNKKACPFYHDQSDSRRDPAKTPYLPEYCEFGKDCLSKQICMFAHNKYEFNYHPLKYKKKYCKHIIEISTCKYGKYCYHAHNDQDIKIQLIHTMQKNDDFFIFKFKTEFCPFPMDHNVYKCVYSHSWEDFRRDILKTPYSKVKCKRWSEVPTGKLEYRCPDGLKCKLSHGFYESDFHPQNYKKFPCQFPECDKRICPFLHLEESQKFRMLDANKEFFIYPYNRILPNTFIEKTSFFKARSQNLI